jgi:hypothetical protein
MLDHCMSRRVDWHDRVVNGIHPEVVDLERAWIDFDLALRSREGFSEALFARVRSALAGCAEEWRGEPTIPRRAVNILVDMFPAMEANADLYGDETRDRILDTAFTLQDLVGGLRRRRRGWAIRGARYGPIAS